MREYVVYVPSLWYTRYYLEAKSKSDALEKVRKAEVPTSDSAEYLRQLEPEECPWRVQYLRKRK